MILTFGSSRRAVSQSVEASGSSVAGMVRKSSVVIPGRANGATPESRRRVNRSRFRIRAGARPGMTKETSTLLLRLDFLDWPAGIAPGREPAAHMRDRLQSHVLRGFSRQRRAHAAGAMKDELLVALKNRLGIGARRIDPEFQHAAGAGERAGNPALALDLAGIADIDDHDVVALRSLDGVGGAQRFDLGTRLVDQRLDAAMDGLGHFLVPPNSVIPGRSEASNPE